MTEPRARAAAAIARASHELDRALREIDEMQTYDPALVGHVAHALSNYISVTAATVEMLRLTLRDYPDPDVRNWVDGIGHAADPGPGLTRPQQDKAFQEFGLSVALEFIRRMDGDLWYDSESAHEGIFSFRLTAHE